MAPYVLLLAGVLLGSPDAESVSYEQAGSRMAVARVRNWISGYQKPGPTVNGTGTLTAIDGNEGLILTAAHLFESEVGPITVEFFAALWGPARMPADIAQRLSKELAAIIARPQIREQIDRHGFALAASTPAELDAFTRRQMDAWGRGFKEAGIHPE